MRELFHQQALDENAQTAVLVGLFFISNQFLGQFDDQFE